MASPDPVVRMSITVPTSLAKDIERYIDSGDSANRSRFFTTAASAFIAQLKRERLRQDAALLDDTDNDDALDDIYQSLRQR